MFALFCTIGGAWFWYCWNNKQYAHRIHILMGVLCLFKALTVMSQVCATLLARTGSSVCVKAFPH
jgi:hypothetical protein